MLDTAYIVTVLLPVLSVHHQIPYSEYENMLVGEGLLNVAVVIKDELTKERVLASEEFNIIAPQISIEVQVAL